MFHERLLCKSKNGFNEKTDENNIYAHCFQAVPMRRSDHRVLNHWNAEGSYQFVFQLITLLLLVDLWNLWWVWKISSIKDENHEKKVDNTNPSVQGPSSQVFVNLSIE
jgi:hypothetical protein